MVKGHCNSLNYSKHQLRDEDIPSLRLSQEQRSYVEIDFSSNQLTSRGLEPIVKFCCQCPELRVFKAYKNEIDDDGAWHIAKLLEKCGSIEEIHLSHNYLTAKGARMIVRAADWNRDKTTSPLWLRLEQNWVGSPNEVLRLMVQEYSVCGRSDEWRCNVRHCYWKRNIHVPFLHLQRQDALWEAETTTATTYKAKYYSETSDSYKDYAARAWEVEEESTWEEKGRSRWAVKQEAKAAQPEVKPAAEENPVREWARTVSQVWAPVQPKAEVEKPMEKTLALGGLGGVWIAKDVDPKADEPKETKKAKAKAKKEEPKKEEPKREEPKKLEPKKEEPKKEEPKREEPKREEPKKEEPKKDEPRKEEKKEADPTEAEVKVEVKTEPRWAKKGTNQIQSGGGGNNKMPKQTPEAGPMPVGPVSVQRPDSGAVAPASKLKLVNVSQEPILATKGDERLELKQRAVPKRRPNSSQFEEVEHKSPFLGFRIEPPRVPLPPMSGGFADEVPQESQERLQKATGAKKEMIQEEDHKQAGKFMEALNAIIKEDLEPERQCHAKLFGSMSTGFGTQGCDFDVVISMVNASEEINAADILMKLRKILLEKPDFEVKNIILSARVPILKLEYGGRDVDISVNNDKALKNSRLLHAYAQLDPLIAEFGIAVKLWAKDAQLCGAKDGHLSSYAFILMALYFLQVGSGDQMPSLQEGLDESWVDDEEVLAKRVKQVKEKWKMTTDDVWTLLAGFFAFYAGSYGPRNAANPFVWGTEVVSIRLGTRSRNLQAPKAKEFSELKGRGHVEHLHIEDPVEQSRNLRDVLRTGNEELLLQEMRMMDLACRQHAQQMIIASHAKLPDFNGNFAMPMATPFGMPPPRGPSLPAPPFAPSIPPHVWHPGLAFPAPPPFSTPARPRPHKRGM
ncbi:unnamed protein product [Durusdinium trenchii]|uniref:Poly(A) RNA polymerase mitochondrial-like central palm domain-containing protein n=1 Tax=Durusdinium trenchii TaxID=1381693 RepID=A0ABP0MX72_9DINO